MPRKRMSIDPPSPEFIEAMVQRVRSMTREELLERLAWRPEGAEETWMLSRNGGSASPDADEPVDQKPHAEDGPQ